jgi:hypothetical protein
MILGKWPKWRTILYYVFIFIFNIRPANDTATGTERQLPEVVLTQFVSPDDKHDVLEICRELEIKINT